MYQRILVPIDGSPTAARGLQHALALARLTGAQLRLLHVIDELSIAWGMDAYGADLLVKALREGGEKLLADARAQVEGAQVPVDTLLLEAITGTVAEQIARQAAKWEADLIVMGTHGRRGVRRMLLGSSAESVVRLAVTPVLMVRDPEAEAVASENPQGPARPRVAGRSAPG